MATGETQVTERDRELLAWLARWGAAAQPQLSARFGWSRAYIHARGRVLRAEAMMGYRRPVYELPGIYWTTERGLAQTGVDPGPGLPAVWALWAHLAMLTLVARAEGPEGAAAWPWTELVRGGPGVPELPRDAAGRLLVPDAAIQREGEDLELLFVVPPQLAPTLARVAVSTAATAEQAASHEGISARLVVEAASEQLLGELAPGVFVSVVEGVDQAG